MTKAQMQEIIDQQAQQIRDLSDRNRVLEGDADEATKTSRAYQALRRENDALRKDRDFYKSLAETTTQEKARLQSQMGARLDARVQQVLADNTELLRDHDAAYWIGITQSPEAGYARQLESENSALRKENARLQGRIDMLQTRERHLQNQCDWLLYEQHPEDAPDALPEPMPDVRPVGRPKAASATQTAEARKLRRDGWSVREIASWMGWSVGLTQKTVQSVKVDPEVARQHRAERKARKAVT